MLGADVLFAASDALLATVIARMQDGLDRPALIGLAGAQGSGKSSTAARLAARLSAEGRSVFVRSLDDFYLTREARRRLSHDVHPLLATRGVPGTHDIGLALRLVAELRDAAPGQNIALPAFDKAADDRAAPEEWPHHIGRPDIILLEGWCVGAHPQPEAALADPVNDLEEKEDRDGIWRRYVNAQLKGEYATLFDLFDLTIYLRALSFDHVHAWRAEQEAGLDRGGKHARAPMTSEDLSRFIAHYERITRWMMAEPAADIVVDLDRERRPYRWQEQGEGERESFK